MDNNLTSQKNNLLLAVLPHVAFSGWSPMSIDKGCADIGIDPQQAHILFPSGVKEMILWYSAYADREMVVALQPELNELNGVKAKVFRSIQLRLQQNLRYREAVRLGLSYLLLPWNQTAAWTSLYQTIDGVWHSIGDQSVDFNFYTKRLTLAGVYSSTLFYWLQDSSPNHEKTWDFLHNRLQDTARIPKIRQQLKSAQQHFPSPLRMLKKLRKSL